jgi:hypothetical protein
MHSILDLKFSGTTENHSKSTAHISGKKKLHQSGRGVQTPAVSNDSHLPHFFGSVNRNKGSLSL